ncbi:MAG: hypothetical protein R3292_07960 [Alcanivorax sp.]|nr:hypothetical protein [Alcanivorax sp.]
MSQTLVVWYQQQRVGRLIVNGAQQMAFVCDGDAVGNGWQLAPFHDLVCTLAIPHVSHRLALPVGSKDDPQNLHRNH